MVVPTKKKVVLVALLNTASLANTERGEADTRFRGMVFTIMLVG